ncbi:hypothetical protein A4X06_0g5714 [Tilletia controversa]|uniref:Reverse transcriptase Ty1/copia-type domain-containing protein n=1 Tax=Tilletia controversa TaxID=13291 RepID=A0A8X7MPX8_9BASI|nr:hypothetical protein CF328_g6414 [Tilletia controversa]KAE8245374.1 hypothetical protein A4X06_0g5714 [Tilletia controversa]
MESLAKGRYLPQVVIEQAVTLLRASTTARAEAQAHESNAQPAPGPGGSAGGQDGTRGAGAQGAADPAQRGTGTQGGEATGAVAQMGIGDGSGHERRSARLAGLEAEPMELPAIRKRKEPGYSCYAVLDPSDVPYGDPRTVGEAMARPDWPEWDSAMRKELQSHAERGTWEMIHGVDYDETFAPTSRLQILRLFCSLSAALDLEFHQIDFETAYLNANFKHDIYMEVPEGVEALPDEVLKLRLALYGLKQSGHDWHAALRDALDSIGFQQCEFDPSIFVRNGERAAMLLVYLDDIIVATPQGADIEGVKKELLGLFKGTDLGPVHHVLGIRVTRDRKAGAIHLDQERYAEEVLERFGMDKCKHAKTPMEAKNQLRQAKEGDTRCDRALYLAIVGCLAYLAQETRPDLAFLVSALGKFNADPTQEHLAAAWRGLR